MAVQCDRGKAFVSGLLFGSESTFAGGEMGRIERAVVASEELAPEDFIIPRFPRLSSRGGRREILGPVRDLACRAEGDTMVFEFSLPPGAYATSLLGEFIKGDSPASPTAKTI